MTEAPKRRGRPANPTTAEERQKFEAMKQEKQAAREQIEFTNFKIGKCQEKIARLQAQINKIQKEDLDPLQAKLKELRTQGK